MPFKPFSHPLQLPFGSPHPFRQAVRLGHSHTKGAWRRKNVEMDVILAGVGALIYRDVHVVAVLLFDRPAEAVKQVMNRLQLRRFKGAQFAHVPHRQHHKMAIIQRLNVGDAEAVLILVNEPVVLVLRAAQGAVRCHELVCSCRQ